MMRVPFNPQKPDISAVRQIVLERLKRQPDWKALDHSGSGFQPYVEYEGYANPERLAFFALQVFWQLINEGIIAPGISPQGVSANLPHFHITEYGKIVLQSGLTNPHDPIGYLENIRRKISTPDDTVIAYLTEALHSFVKGTPIASTVMLGIAAERVFLLLAESLEKALSDATEKSVFRKILDSYVMKPKLYWVNQKFQFIQDQRKRFPAFPENATLMVVAMYNYIRLQRNDLGHPRENPPSVTKEEALANLQIFPNYYETAEAVRNFLVANNV